jgi:fructosamine-3-kinase
MITFLNQPRLFSNEIDKESNERRIGLIPHVETFLNQHSLFKDRDVEVTFPFTGAGSFTCILEATDLKKVLKIALSSQSFYESEGSFLKAWENVGVKVPHVIEEGAIDGSYYLLMDFINAKTLHEEYKKGAMIREEIFVKMGSLLRMMHTAKSEGFGVVKDGKGGHSQFSEWLDYQVTHKSSYVDDERFLDDSKHGNFATAIKVINDYVGTSTESSFCHNDFTFENIFATEPLTVFDPVPILGHPYMDLAKAIVTALGREISDEASEHLIRGYSGTDLVLNRSALQAAIIIQSYMRFGYWSKAGKRGGIKDVLVYLEKTKHFLTV